MMGTFDVRRGQWGLLTDLIYMDLDGSKSSTRDASIAGGSLPVNATADVDITLESWIWTIAAYYRALEPNGSNLDIAAGTRYLDVEQTANWKIKGNVGPIPAADRIGEATAKLSNWDMVLAFRFSADARYSQCIPIHFTKVSLKSFKA